MSKEIDWGVIHGEGDILCMCDSPTCYTEESFPFEDSYYDFKEVQGELRAMGWVSKRIGGTWYDFCSYKCYQDFLDKKVKNIE